MMEKNCPTTCQDKYKWELFCSNFEFDIPFSLLNCLVYGTTQKLENSKVFKSHTHRKFKFTCLRYSLRPEYKEYRVQSLYQIITSTQKTHVYLINVYYQPKYGN